MSVKKHELMYLPSEVVLESISSKDNPSITES